MTSVFLGEWCRESMIGNTETANKHEVHVLPGNTISSGKLLIRKRGSAQLG